LVCRLCPEGYACPGSSADSTPVPCGTGTYSAVGASACEDCPVGQYCPTPSVAYACEPGYFANTTKSLTCAPCTAGSECSDPAVSPVVCTTGYSADLAIACAQCPAGHSCEQGLSVVCDAGTYSLLGQDDCTPCPEGQLCTDSTEAPGACPAGSSCSGMDATPCEDGEYSILGSLECEVCDIGHYCPTKTEAQRGCPSGTHQPSPSQSSCIECVPGTRCPGMTATPISCDKGTYSGAMAATCIPCPAGTLGTDGILCPKCDAGTACVVGQLEPATACLTGTFSSDSSGECFSCPAGYTCNTTAIVTICDKGTYSALGEALCRPCAAGYANVNAGASSCSFCPDGTHTVDSADNLATSAAVKCEVCPVGYKYGARFSA